MTIGAQLLKRGEGPRRHHIRRRNRCRFNAFRYDLHIGEFHLGGGGAQKRRFFSRGFDQGRAPFLRFVHRRQNQPRKTGAASEIRVPLRAQGHQFLKLCAVEVVSPPSLINCCPRHEIVTRRPIQKHAVKRLQAIERFR